VREGQVISRPDASFLYPKSKRYNAAEVDIVQDRFVRVHLALDRLHALRVPSTSLQSAVV
jgi:hypothetical protein